MSEKFFKHEQEDKGEIQAEVEVEPVGLPEEVQEKIESLDNTLAEAINKSETGEKIEKKRVEIDPETPPEEIMAKFNVSRTTAWRIRKRGYVNLNYRTRILEPDLTWNRANEENILESAKKGVVSIIARMAKLSGQSVEEFLRPYNIEDAIQEGALRIMEISGNQDRDSENWRIAVAKIGACKFLERMVKKARWKSYDSSSVNKIDTINGVIAKEFIGLK